MKLLIFILIDSLIRTDINLLERLESIRPVVKTARPVWFEVRIGRHHTWHIIAHRGCFRLHLLRWGVLNLY